MANAESLTFGYRDNRIIAPAIWGARAIYDRRDCKRPFLDIVWDRCSRAIDSQEEWEKLAKALDGTKSKPGALDSLRKLVSRNKLPMNEVVDDAEVGTVTVKGVRFDYRDAGGYLYIAARLA